MTTRDYQIKSGNDGVIVTHHIDGLLIKFRLEMQLLSSPLKLHKT